MGGAPWRACAATADRIDGNADRSEEFLLASRLANAAGKVLRALPTDERDLYRSLTVMCLLDRRGLDQMLVIAAREQPFSAYAWVEVDGHSLTPTSAPGYQRVLEF